MQADATNFIDEAARRDGAAGGTRWDGDAMFVMGDVSVPVSSITAYSLEEEFERDVAGLLASAGILLNLSAVCLIGVMAFGWRENFLIAVVLLLVFGFASLFEISTSARSRFQRLTLFQRGTAPIVLSCADRDHIEHALAFLAEHHIKRV